MAKKKAAALKKKVAIKKVKEAKPKRVESVLIPTFEEIEFTCINCGKVVKMVKQTGMSTEGLLCQRCSVGEGSFEMDTD